MEKIEIICELVTMICGVIPTIVSMILLVKNIIETKNWNLVVSMIQEAMTAVETYAIEHPDMTSEDKLNMALEAVQKACIAAGITVDTSLITKIVAYIEEMCKWTKTVNTSNSK